MVKERIKPEIMSPAGYWPQLQAAIEAGADAVYFGLKHFTARAKVGFTLSELPEVMRTLHRRGVKGYVTFNTLVFDHELAEAARTLAAIAEAGADAIIVQDVGIAKLARRIAPELDVHGSTQMSITSAEGVELAQAVGVSRVVLARELSLSDVRAIRAKTDCELEMFVHGALCVSYSGQCFSSEAWGGRSANRGQCAQACRLPYQMIVDGVKRPLGDARYLLSPGDLYALHQVPEIVETGISSLKIEGRYKDADYVALTTRAYRQAVDEAWSGKPLTVSAEEELQLEQVYSRGLGPHFINGTNHQLVVIGRAPRHRGVAAGKVIQVGTNHVVVKLDGRLAASPLKAGDGVVFDAADWRSPNEAEEGGRIYAVKLRSGNQAELYFGNQAIDYSRIRVGDRLWRTHDPDLDKAVKPYLEPAAPVHKQTVHVVAEAREGARLKLTWRLENGRGEVMVQSGEALSAAQKQPLQAAALRAQLERLGNTPYELGDLELSTEGAPFAPSSMLNQMRREAVEQLEALQAQTARREVHDAGEILSASLPASQPASAAGAPQLHLLVRTAEQLEAAIALRPASITLDYLELYGLKPSVERVQQAGIEARAASPRVLKPSEERVVHFLLKLGCPLLVRSAGLLHSLQGVEHPPLIGDFSLNAANALSVEVLLGLGITRLTPTHDLNADQIVRLAGTAGATRLEVIAYQHLPVFHTEHCVFCRFLSTGTNFENCGHPCEKHRVALQDDSGRAHPVLADVGCRNTVFGAEAQEASAHLDAWLRAGIAHYRLEFAHESPEQVERIGRAFGARLSGAITSVELARQIQRAAPQGVTEGSLFVPKNYLTLPVLG